MSSLVGLLAKGRTGNHERTHASDMDHESGKPGGVQKDDQDPGLAKMTGLQVT